jgi:3-methyladenine DNA glycosylase/8-oxoguanine DNA glycosylase
VKINVEFDCTPEEARRVMGMPDLTPLHDKYLATMMNAMEGKAAPEMIEQMMKSWGPMGEAGLSMFRQLFETATAKPHS